MKKFATLLAILGLVVAANASEYNSVGYSEDTTTIWASGDDCPGEFFLDADGSWENGYCWQYGGIVPPYYGAFGEGYDTGYTKVECGSYFLTQVGGYYGQTADLYVWAGGVSTAPGDVICVVTGYVFDDIAYWPSISQHDVPLGCCVEGEITVGYWGNWPEDACGYFCAADLDGFGGHPWTCIAPGIGYPTGWQDPSVVWGPTMAMGLGVYMSNDPSPVETATWSSIKALFE